MSRKTIEKFTFRNWDHVHNRDHEMVEGTIGVHISETDDGRPHIHLFGLEDYVDEKRYGIDAMPQNAPIICQQVLDAFAPDLSLADVSWQYTKPPMNTTFEYEERGGVVCGVTFVNDALFLYGNAKDIQEYEDALNDPDGFEELMGERYIHDTQTTAIVIPTPHHPLGFSVMAPSFTNSAIQERFELVLVDTNKFMNQWMDQRLAQYPEATKGIMSMFKGKSSARALADEDIALMNSAVETSIKHTEPNFGAIDPAHINYYNDELTFNNGRHRSANLAILGAPFIPVEISKRNDVEGFKAKFEWTGGKTPDNKPKVSDDHAL